MSVLNKMSNTLDSEQYLDNIYKNLKKEIINNVSLTNEKRKAKKLEAFLNLIKSAEKDSSNLSISKFWPKAEQIALINSLSEINPRIFKDGLMLKQNYNSSYQLGSFLEHDLARIFKSFEANVTGKKYQQTQKTYKVGGRRTQIPDLIQKTNEIMTDEYKEVYQQAARGLREYKDKHKTNVNNFVTIMNSVQGKTDIQGLNPEKIILSSNLSSIQMDIIDALSNASFSVKNYLSTNDIHLGQTNPFRVFSTAASAVGVNGGPERYYRAIECLQGHNSYHSTTASSFYRIRAIYELTGAKMQYVNQDALGKIISGQYVKFLIINNPWGKIRVISTAEIVKKLIKNTFELTIKNWEDALYGPITLSQKTLEII